MTLASATVLQARDTLIDAAAITWTDVQLLQYLNQGIAQACGTLLDLFVVSGMVALVAGPRQNIPAGGLLFMDLPRTAAGAAVKQADASEFAKTMPNWPATAASASPTYYFFDPRNPTSFLVYPPATAGAMVEEVYAAVPPAIALGGTIPISAAFDTALWAFVCGMAYSKNTKRQDMAQTKLYMDVFNGILGTWKKTASEMVTQPDPKGVF